MNDNEQRNINDMIREELGDHNSVATATPVPLAPPAPAALGAIEAPPLPSAPVAESEPRAVRLEPHEALMTDAIRWRLDAVEKTIALANIESGEIDKMKAELLNTCVKKYDIDVSTHDMQIDASNKTLTIKLKA